MGYSVGVTKSISRQWLGRTPYSDGLRIQDDVANTLLALQGDPEKAAHGVILGLEHEPVITLGKRGNSAEDLKIDRSEIEQSGVVFFESSRGGQATLHSDGQLVIYPILPLRSWGLGAKSYVTLLEDVTAETLLRNFDLRTSKTCGEPGLYTSEGKITFFGVRISRGISSHGIAINVSNDLGLFSMIRSCGKDAEHFASLQTLGFKVTPEEVFPMWFQVFMEFLESPGSKKCGLTTEDA